MTLLISIASSFFDFVGVTPVTFTRWKSKYGSMSKSDVKRLKELEKENARLKRLVADQAFDICVLEFLAKFFLMRGQPAFIRSDNGPEFIVEKLRNWLSSLEVKTLYIPPGSPWENGYCESFNGSGEESTTR